MEQDCQVVIDLIDEAVTAGARHVKARAVLEVDVRTLQRWSGRTRNWNPVDEAWLNPPKESLAEKEQESKAA